MASASFGGDGGKLQMKLLVDTKGQRVLYGEASKDVVDFLFSLLTLPVGTAVKLVTANSMVGSIGNLYGSVGKLDDTYICSADAKGALLTPAGGCGIDKFLKLPAAASPAPKSISLYRCNSDPYKYPACRPYVSYGYDTQCPKCVDGTYKLVKVVAGSAAGGGGGTTKTSVAVDGFVQGVVTYTVMDDLTVAPMSTISGITLLNTLGVTDIGSLQEKTVQLGYTESLEILKMSLQSKNVLTDVFIGKKTKA